MTIDFLYFNIIQYDGMMNNHTVAVAKLRLDAKEQGFRVTPYPVGSYL